jgi:hypothetical protein
MGEPFPEVERYAMGTIVKHYDKRSEKDRPYLIVSNRKSGTDGYGEYIVLPITGAKKKRKKWFYVEPDYKTCGLTKRSYIRGNKPDVILHETILEVMGSVPEFILEQSKKRLNECICDESLSIYQKSFTHWVEAYNIAYNKNYSIGNSTAQMKDEFHISIGRFINKNRNLITLVFKPEYLESKMERKSIAK